MDVAPQIFAKPDEAVRTSEQQADAILVKRVQEGYIEAFDQLVHRYRGRLFSIVYNLVGNAEDASDILQESFIKSFRAIARFRAEASFFTWLYRITLNTATSHMRKQKIRRFFHFSRENQDEEFQENLWGTAPERSADEAALLSELQVQLNQALQQLPVKHRTAIVLFEIEGLSHAEIGQIMDCNEGTARSRVFYAKEMLRKHLQPYVSQGLPIDELK